MKNILLITSDEMRADILGCMGNPDCRTPHIDSLAARGTLLENHFAQFPKCVPSRVSMMTGRYTHTDGVRTVNKTNLIPKGTPNMLTTLREKHGYHTAVLGLNHVWEEEWFYGGNKAGAGAAHYTSFTDGQLRGMAMVDREYPPRNPAIPPHPKELDQIDYDGCWEGTKKGFFDENRVDQAELYLRELRDPDRPFYLQLNLSKPHPPYSICEPYFSMYDREKITPFPYDLPENAPLPLAKQRELRLGNDAPEAAHRELQAVYYGMCTYIDDLVGRTLAILDELGLREDTLVIFTADHGDYAGQYGINEKWDASLQDCLLHVPFIIAGPGIPENAKTDALSEHVDLPETIFDYLGITQDDPEWMIHGQSLLPTVRGEARREAVFADGGHEAPMRARFSRPVWDEKADGTRTKSTGGKQLVYQECPDSMARCKMVRTNDWKLVIRETGGNELYHVKDDPWEMKNLYGQSEHNALVQDLQLKLIQWTLRSDTDRPFQPQVGA